MADKAISFKPALPRSKRASLKALVVALAKAQARRDDATQAPQGEDKAA